MLPLRVRDAARQRLLSAHVLVILPMPFLRQLDIFYTHYAVTRHAMLLCCAPLRR